MRLTESGKPNFRNYSPQKLQAICDRLCEIEDAEQADVPYNDVKDLFNSVCMSYPKVTKISADRKKSIKARFNEGYDLNAFKKAFEYCENCDFLKGKNERNFKASFDFVIGPKFTKILDRGYGEPVQAEEHSYNLDMFDKFRAI